eukprot:GHVU01049976.1.p1 GENE.GHVU01049976.1~~GHVU01049976.1.p1  ORF type:complete len:162 (+),score=30.31 GHVU01049976.1:209-694(+)
MFTRGHIFLREESEDMVKFHGRSPYEIASIMDDVEAGRRVELGFPIPYKIGKAVDAGIRLVVWYSDELDVAIIQSGLTESEDEDVDKFEEELSHIKDGEQIPDYLQEDPILRKKKSFTCPASAIKVLMPETFEPDYIENVIEKMIRKRQVAMATLQELVSI